MERLLRQSYGHLGSQNNNDFWMNFYPSSEQRKKPASGCDINARGNNNLANLLFLLALI